MNNFLTMIAAIVGTCFALFLTIGVWLIGLVTLLDRIGVIQ